MRIPSRLLLGLCLWLGSCATLSRHESASFPQELVLNLPADAALHLRGSVDGPLGGLGPSLRFDAWYRSGTLRADLRYEEEDRPRHEVLLWTPENVLLFDRDRGGLTEIGDGAKLPAWGTRFSLEALHWLSTGRWPGESPLPEFSREGRDWTAQWGELLLVGRTVDRSAYLSRTQLRWRSEGDSQELSAELESQRSVAGGRIPQRVRLDGDPLEMEVLLRMEVEIVENKGDEVLDPLSDP